ncbi:MAG: hypothetical protein HN729_09955 [Candidatus Marinimicrobia bacterium]|jgi:uncharacterized protein (TIGR02145 family)|nr:hypothetical protein [Candidatus Neomarinimicrobiota bacterium]MBT3634999.1 hypothetical protein [Candidatus Neomarinimicrobiota bacterium]MBT3683830.1 hypothetical protein [Candidatus Neomarinimicrobiota bacterium]MBT3760651.1 hypothetical protein [Candidatus Neomarinimicrobiota bacterium]MBT3896840.1 hypothetical protein [Candidatus Neomarinimicrobiota bacterium]
MNIIIMLLFALSPILSQSAALQENDGTNRITDIDGNIYKTVKIGNQIWMAENLKASHYMNGDSIYLELRNDQWSNLKTGAFCYYDNDPENIENFGYLYNWYVVSDERQVCPENWHIPTEMEFEELEGYLGMDAIDIQKFGWRGNDQGGKLKDENTFLWDPPNVGATNESGFSAIPGGFRRRRSGAYEGINDGCYIWSSTDYIFDEVSHRVLSYFTSNIYHSGIHKSNGMSIRCIQDKPNE